MQLAQYQGNEREEQDAADSLDKAVMRWVCTQFDERLPGHKLEHDYDRTACQQRVDYLCGGFVHTLAPDGKKSRPPTQGRVLTSTAEEFLCRGVSGESFRALLPRLLVSFALINVPLGRACLLFSPCAPTPTLVLDEARILVHPERHVAVLCAPRDDARSDVVAALPSQCDLALWWGDARQIDEGIARYTLMLSYANRLLQFDVDEGVHSAVGPLPRYYALSHQTILSRLLK